MKRFLFCTLALICAWSATPVAFGQDTNASAPATNAPAMAIVIVYDMSGSMKDKVKDASGRKTPKYVIGNNALMSVADKLQEFADAKHTNILAGLVFFRRGQVQTGIPMGVFQAERFKAWARENKSPDGGTPLGGAVQAAANILNHAGPSLKKHILVITDGESNMGATPQEVLLNLKNNNASIPTYFVAFDVAAKIFEPVKAQGATVVSAADETGLRVQLDSIVGKKILLEAE